MVEGDRKKLLTLFETEGARSFIFLYDYCVVVARSYSDYLVT